MASDETWNKLRYFKKDSKVDQWGDTSAISDTHLLRLDDFRHWLGVPVYVLHGVKTRGHSPSSFHYRKTDKNGKEIGACATDIIIPDYDKTPFDLVLDATRFGFTGIGYYPHWSFRGKRTGGLHVDSRPLKWDNDGTLNYSHSRWLGVLNQEGKQEYIALDFHNLVKYSNYGSSENDLTKH